MHAPAGHVLHDRIADQFREARREGGPGHRELPGERGDRPLPCGIAVDQGYRTTDVPVLEGAEPTLTRGWVGLDPGSDRLDDEYVAEPRDHLLATRSQLPRLRRHQSQG